MNPSRFRNQMFGLLAMTLPLMACAQQNESAERQAAPIASRSAAPAPQLVSGLPDFTNLVEQVGPGVVNIETVITRKDMMRRSGRGQMPDDQEIPEFFRRFFGPGFPMPGAPGQGGGEGDGGIAGRSMGSGFIISADGYVMTNHHVVDGASEVTVKLNDRREFKAKVVGSDEQYDVALLKIEAKGLPIVRIGDSNALKSGQWVVAIGSPLGLDHSVTAGIVSALGRSTGNEQRYVPFIQTDVAINQGNSGGPLLNTRGEVVGINSQIFSSSGGYMGISFAIPIDLAMSASEQIRKTGRVTRGQLGVMIGAIDSLKAQGLGLPDSRGALVNQLVVDGAAAKAGLEVGDVIRSVDGKQIDSFNELPPQVGLKAPGSKVKLGIVRDGKPREIEVTLTALDTDKVAAEGAAGPADDGAPKAPASVALLGLQVADLTAAERDRLGLEAGQGVRIAAVTGDQARSTQPPLTPGLVILRVGRTEVGSVADLNKALARHKKGDVVMLLVSSGRASTYVAIKAGG